ncbi:MAG: AAA family ATPase [Gammaproteobacteria bacterium]|nr:AAA family ATPase [Gammaproteobacteria bacterium]MDE0479946.1 AAA family ATPase [Gammaproteobacteria bacterium]MDE0507499.1 AAA family ATPase [Gammaproteobacteria bacterium]MXY90420.1 AAA domain-containing protein [Gammaproteobacteria bacterium]MYG95947.1 AAA domain-containing protein [Gammaproteobacteria bacterium]
MNLRKLYEHLDHDVRHVTQASADIAAREGRKAISVELFLLTLLRDRVAGPPLAQALDAAGGDAPAMETALADLVKDEARGAPGTLPRFGETLAQVLGEAWDLAFGDYGEGRVNSVRIVETLARRSELWPQLATSLPGLAGLDLAALAARGRPEAARAAGDRVPAATHSEFPELSRYGKDMIAAAKSGRFDPVVGLHGQMQAIAAILLRRRQNSVAVVGEAGVGKSACALGFVDALANRRAPVPEALYDTPVWSLDLSALRAGAVVRGVLEERLQAIVGEAADSGMVLLVDDLHLLFGDQGGGADALRTVLSDGSVRLLASCGWREWRRHVEPDAGLARRIASVRIQEPDDEEALRIVSGLAPALAEHHAVDYGENVLDYAVGLSRRYIVGRQLPDKAIVVLDSACARARMATGQTGGGEEEPAAAENGAAHDEPEVESAEPPPVTVTEDHVASVVSDLTGVPIGSMLSDVGKMASRLEQLLGERVVGQDGALARCAAQARAYLAGLSDRRRPVGALMFCGPSGVGKTETAHALADALFGGRILTINMSEYQEAHTVSGLKGAPAGYVGYGEGGVLTEGIRRTPYCVVLLDEIEKAHGDVIEMLYQVLDRGWMEDAEGIEADFSNALIVLTSNAGDKIVEEAAAAEQPIAENVMQQTLARALGKHFPAAFVGRLQLVPFWPLGEDTLASIAAMRLDRLAEVYRSSHRARLDFAPEVLQWLVGHVRSTPQGARFLDGIVARSIRPAVAEHVLARLGAEQAPGDITLSFADGEFSVRDRAAEDAP